MNMNRNKFIIYVTLFTFLFISFSMVVYAETTTTVAGPVEYVLENPCDVNSIRKVIQIIGYIFLVAKILVPLLIIGYGTYDLFKSVIDKDNKSFSKQISVFLKRVVAGLIVFFVPNIVAAVFSLSDKLNVMNTSQYKTCAACLFEPTGSTCIVTD